MRFYNLVRQIDKLIQLPYVAVLLISVLVAILLANQVFWGIFSGTRLWGDWFNHLLGLTDLLDLPRELDNPFIHRISLLNISFLFGAMAIALVTKKLTLQFVSKQNVLWATVGGCFMGLGATIAGGCTIGGFFSPTSLTAPTGFVMLIGLFIGALIGYQCLMWTMLNIKWGRAVASSIGLDTKRWQFGGVLIAVAVLVWAGTWYFSDAPRLAHRAVIIVVGLSLGVVMQRSRFCFSNAIRSPILGGNILMTKAVMLLLLLSILVNGMVVDYFNIDVYAAIPPTFWLGSLLGGLLFGFGMMFGGGCASGTLWRSAEGSIKALITLFFMGWSGSIFTALGKKSGLLIREITPDWHERTILGEQFYLSDDLSGFMLAMSFTIVFVVSWYGLIKLAQKKRWYF